MSDRILQFVTSDWHIGHTNVIKFDNRPFRDVDHMHRVLVNNFNATVPPNAITYFLGDMGLGSSGLLRSVVTQLNGMKGAVGGEPWHGANRHDRFTVTDEGQFHCHGHIHSPNGGKSQRILGKQLDVGVAANNYRPVSFSEIESWIAKYGR